MLGAIIGDIVGSRFEFNNYRSKNFELFTKDCFFTDDSVMTLAVGWALLKTKKNTDKIPSELVKVMTVFGKKYPDAGYGGSFIRWLFSSDKQPYNSYGNGSAMRVSACGEMASSLEETKKLSFAVTAITHNHPEGIKGAEATAVSVYFAKTGKTKEEIKEYVLKNYYNIDFTLDEIRDSYEFNEICQDTVPQALQAFFESTSFEDAIRNAISIGGDSDTIGAITGAVAGAYYGIPKEIIKTALTYLDDELKSILKYAKEI